MSLISYMADFSFFLTGRVTEFRKVCENSINVIIMFLLNFSERCAINLLQHYLLTDQMCGILLWLVSSFVCFFV